MATPRDQLLGLLRQKSFRYRADPPFQLVSGRTSPYYVDCKPVMHDPQGKALIGAVVFAMIKDLEVAAIGGLTMGADPIAYATSLISYQQGQPIKSFSVRKTPKGHGTGKLIEGDLKPGERVVIVEDVITTGSSALAAVKAAREEGLLVLKVIALVDREEGGREALIQAVPEVEAVFTLSDLKGSSLGPELT